MLVLSRKIGERLVIGDDIVVTVTKTSGNRVTLGIDAPRDVAIRRAELTESDEAKPSPAVTGLSLPIGSLQMAGQ